jgi:hypothetical protein
MARIFSLQQQVGGHHKDIKRCSWFHSTYRSRDRNFIFGIHDSFWEFGTKTGTLVKINHELKNCLECRITLL